MAGAAKGGGRIGQYSAAYLRTIWNGIRVYYSVRFFQFLHKIWAAVSGLKGLQKGALATLTRPFVGATGAMDSRLAALQQVILKKDLAILELQTQLDAYRALFGELPAADGDDRSGDQSGGLRDADPVTTQVAAAANATGSRGRGGRQRSSSSGGGLPAWLARAARAGSGSSPGPKPAARQFASPVSSPAALKSVIETPAEAQHDPSSLNGGGGSVPASAQAATDSQALPPPPPPSSDVDGVSRSTGKNVVLDFAADSPMFRRQLEGYDEVLAGLRTLLKELQGRMKEYVGAGMKFGDEEAALADELVARRHARALFTTSCPELGSLSSVFNQVHDTLAQLQSSRVSMLMSVEALLQQAIESLSDQELKDTLDLRKEVSRLGDEYETQLAKLLAKPRTLSSASSSAPASNGGVSIASTPSSSSLLIDTVASMGVLGSPSVASITGAIANPGQSPDAPTPSRQQRTLERDALGARLRFELARFDLVRNLNRVDARKKVVLLECFNSLLYALLGHFHACHELVKAVEPALRERQEALQVTKQDVEADDAMWSAQRETLEYRLRGDLERLLASNGAPSGIDNGGATNTAGMPRSMDVPVEIVSRETWSNRYGQQHQTPAPVNDIPTGDVVKQGYLFVRNTMFPARSWKRRWFQIHAGKLYQHRGGRQQHMDLVLVCDLLLARVREFADGAAGAGGNGAIGSSSNGSSSSAAGGSPSLPFCFEVIDSSQARHLLQATSEREVRSWVDAAQRSTAAMLERQSHHKEVHPEQQDAIEQLLSLNPSCADCGARPADWVSINIGCLLCIECSGIHRSLGVHESKVRSLTLDSWDMGLLSLLRNQLGNDIVNCAWEATVPDGWTKPGPQSAREEKTKWITAKYHFHGFAEALGIPDKAEAEKLVISKFLDAAAMGDLKGLVWALAHGVDINARRPKVTPSKVGEQIGGESALHLSARIGSLVCCDYLVLNGASLVATDARGETPYQIASNCGFEDMARTLAHKDGC